MLIVYNRATGEVVDNSGTNSLMPAGPPDDAAFVNTDARKHARAGLALLRLHDVDEADLVAKVLTHEHHVKGGKVVLDGPRPPPKPAAQQPDPMEALTSRVAALESALSKRAVT